MKGISLQELYDHPNLFLSVPHRVHKPILRMMEPLFPGFELKLKESEVHCLQCEGRDTFRVLGVDGKSGTCVGFIGKVGTSAYALCIEPDNEESDDQKHDDQKHDDQTS